MSITEAIIADKLAGMPDEQIGSKYNISASKLEKIITQSVGINVRTLHKGKKIKTLEPPNFVLENTTLWSFKSRGSWATHSGDYRGNWSPYIPRNIILRYSSPDDLVLDCFCGAGTTAIEAKLLGRRCIAVDVNKHAIDLAKHNVSFALGLFTHQTHEPQLCEADARDLSFLPDSSVDLICTHPPYANIIQYTDNNPADMSFCDIDEFLAEMHKVATENYRVLKPGKFCAILIGDMRRKRHVIPLGFDVIDIYQKVGFELKELVIKRQHNCKTTGFWYSNSIKFNFLLLAHEYLPIFQKPLQAKSYNEQISGLGNRTFSYNLKTASPAKKPDTLETSTVWICSQDDYQEYVTQNILNRYGGSNNAIVDICLDTSKPLPISEEISLLLVNSTVTISLKTPCELKLYLNMLYTVCERSLKVIKPNGFVVVCCKDIRIDGEVIPMAKHIIKTLKPLKLQLKEIIITHNQKEAQCLDVSSQMQNEPLKITHEYVLVFVKKA